MLSSGTADSDNVPPQKTHSSYYRPLPSFRALKVISLAVWRGIVNFYEATLGALFDHFSWNATLYCALGTALFLVFAACALSVHALNKSRGRPALFSMLAFGEAQERPSNFYIEDILPKKKSPQSETTNPTEDESYPAPQRSFMRIDPQRLPSLKT